LSFDDLEVEAKKILPRCLFGFVSGGVETNATRQANRDAFAEWVFRPRVLVNTLSRSPQATLFGRTYGLPFGVAPMGATSVIGYQCELALAGAAGEANIPFALSGTTMVKLERVVEANPDAWFQAYFPGDRARIGALIDRVAQAGYRHLVVTVDVQVAGNRENNVRNGFSLPLAITPKLAWDGITHPRWLVGGLLRGLWRDGMPHFENMEATRGAPLISRTATRSFGRRDALDWDDIAWIRDRWKGVLILKGILTAEDTALARGLGIDGVVVSNHGGRQLDGAVASLAALPEVVAERGSMAVMLDSGIRRGSDIMKALALGADFVFIGRPFLYAAAIAAKQGVAHAITIMAEEIDRDMAMLGCNTINQLNKEYIRPARRAIGDGNAPKR
jgi:L-lactate dehydrogenase (cytochrome)